MHKFHIGAYVPLSICNFLSVLSYMQADVYGAYTLLRSWGRPAVGFAPCTPAFKYVRNMHKGKKVKHTWEGRQGTQGKGSGVQMLREARRTWLANHWACLELGHACQAHHAPTLFLLDAQRQLSSCQLHRSGGCILHIYGIHEGQVCGTPGHLGRLHLCRVDACR